MARTASMTAAAAAALLGDPATLRVDSSNRVLVRKWATGSGLSSKNVYKLSNKELETLYRSNAGVIPAISRADVAAAHAPIVTRQMPMPSVAAAPLPGTDKSPSQMLADMIRLIAGDSVKAITDESRVAEMITEALQSYKNEVGDIVADAFNNHTPSVKITRLEVTTPVGINVLEGVQHCMTTKTILATSIGPAMLIGPAGCGKTTIGKNVAKAFGFDFYITSIVFDTHELLGFVDGHGNYKTTAFRQAFENGGVWVADEVDAWDAAALLAANSALANGYCTFPDSALPVKRHDNFRMIATANTYGHGADRIYVGRNELDGATLDRFGCIDMTYDRVLEKALSTHDEWLEYVWKVRDAVEKHSIRHVVSTRAILFGQHGLSIGLDRADVEEMYVFKGMSKNDRKMI